MDDPGRLVYETTDSGTRVSGTGLPRLRAAVSLGAARSRRRMEASGRGVVHQRQVDLGRYSLYHSTNKRLGGIKRYTA